MPELPMTELTGGGVAAVAIIYFAKTLYEVNRTRNGKSTNGAMNKAADEMGKMCRKLDDHRIILREIRDDLREERRERRDLMSTVVGILKRE